MFAGYIVEKKLRDSDRWERVNKALLPDTKCLVDDLVENSEVEFRVLAVNAVGPSEPSGATTPVKIKEKIGK